MFKCLVPGCLGINLPWEEWPALAASAGFEAVDVHPLDPAKGANYYRDALAKHSIRAGGAPLPVEFRKDEAAFEASLASLDVKAALAAEIGCTAFYTWIMPASDELPFAENYALHEERLGEAASILSAHGCRLGLEFVGPKTSRIGKNYVFLHTMDGMIGLCEDVGPNAGLLLDSWHWYVSGATVKDILALSAKDVVYVHVNDAPAGIARDEQMDLVRRLSGDTGVIDIAGFMGALRKIGYDGPVTPEPFVKELATLAPDKAASLAARAMETIWNG